jgi:small GTP-binding protein
MEQKKIEENPPIATLERKLEGHRHWVNSVTVSPNSTWALSGSADKTIKIWDLKKGQCRATLKGHKDQVRSVAITPDGTRILSGSYDSFIGVWEAKTGKNLAFLKAHEGGLHYIAALPDSQRVLSCAATGDSTPKLWDLDSDKCLKTFDGHSSIICSVSVSPDGRRAVSGSYDKTLKYWDLETGQCLATLEGHSGNVNSVQITADGRWAVSGSNDRTVKLWDLETGTCRGTFEGHKSEIKSVALSPDGKLVASTGFTDGTVRIWDVTSGACLQEIKDYDIFFQPLSVTFSKDGRRLVVGNAVLNDTHYSLYIYRLTGVTGAVPDERYTNAKVVLVGESGVGKSGLAHRLIEDQFIPTDSTHGMSVWRLDLPLEAKKGLEREALLWDLAGQEDYRLIHQLFLDETSLALVLFNPQKNDPFAEVVDWLKALAAVSAKDKPGRPVKLLVAARTDVGSITVSQKKIDRFLEQHGFAAYLPTSAKSGHNCSDSLNDNQPSALKQAIAQHIPWPLLPWTSTPRLLRELKNAVLVMKEEKLGLLGFPVLAKRLKQELPQEVFGEDDVRTAVSLLANHGLVMPLQFGDLVLLQPEILNGYASAVIRAARAHIDEIGCVCQDDVFQRRIDMTGVTRLALAEEDLLLRAMVQTLLNKSLCIAEDTDKGKQLIFPSQYRRERDIPVHPEIFVSYTFTGELAVVYTTLVVRLWYGGGYDNKELWCNAAEFSTPGGKTMGLVMERSGEGEGTISVFFHHEVTEDAKVMFSEYVHRHLHKYGHEVRRDRHYVCGKCGNPVIDRDTVRKRLAAGREFIYCQDCDAKIPLLDRIEQRLASEPVARRVAQMDEKAGLALDSQALEQILIGHMMAICGEINQIFRPGTMFDYGIDGEIEFKDKKGKASGKKIYVQLKSGGSYLRHRQRDNNLIFDVKNPRYLEYWKNIPVDVYLVIRDEQGVIRWMNITTSLRARKNWERLQLIFDGEKLDSAALLRVRETLLQGK